MRGWLCCALLLFLAACDQGPVARSELASWKGSIGRLVVDGKALARAEFERRRGAEAADGEMSIVPVEDADFGQALRLATLRQPPALGSLEASLLIHGDIEEGAACWLHLQARAEQPQGETELARLSIGFRATGADDQQIFEHQIYIEPTWTAIDIPFDVRRAFEAGAAKLVFGVGTQLQVVDIGNIAVRCFEPESPPGALPKTSFTYAGRGDQAAWRKIAEGHIDRYRRGDLAIKVVDAVGEPVPDAEIHVQMTRHAFKFGTAVDAGLLAGKAAAGEASPYRAEDISRYRKVLQELFNIVTVEDGMSWKDWEDEARRGVTEEAIAWVGSLGLDLRGNRLVSGTLSDLPAELQGRRDEPEIIRAALRERVNRMVGDLDGRVVEWDVVDRPRDRHDLMDLLGWGEIDAWFKAARAGASAPRLLLNESDVLAGDRLPELVTMLDQLKGRNVPIDALGIKSHFDEQPPSITVLSDRLDQLASFDLPLIINEFDMDTDDPALHADFTRDLMILAFSHPSVEGFLFWGFWAGRQDLPQSAMFQRDWSITRTGEVYRDLVLRRWWTDDVALSNVEGDLLTRAFLGDYQITARKDDLAATSLLSLDAAGASITLTLDRPTSG